MAYVVRLTLYPNLYSLIKQGYVDLKCLMSLSVLNHILPLLLQLKYVLKFILFSGKGIGPKPRATATCCILQI